MEKQPLFQEPRRVQDRYAAGEDSGDDAGKVCARPALMQHVSDAARSRHVPSSFAVDMQCPDDKECLLVHLSSNVTSGLAGLREPGLGASGAAAGQPGSLQSGLQTWGQGGDLQTFFQSWMILWFECCDGRRRL